MRIFFILLFTLSASLLANEKVVLQLKWLHQFQFAGYYAAKEKGFYEELGLDVEIRQRSRDKNNIEQVIKGEAQYGVSDSVLLLYKAKKEPVVIVAPIFQHSASVILTLKSSGIDSPYKLDNKKLVFYKKDTDGFGILSMLENIDVNPDLTRVKHIENYTSLLNHKADAYSGYITNEPFYFKEKGIDINIINPSNYGLDLYGDMLFTNSKEARTNPHRVQRFKQATIKGWYYALEHKEEIIKLIKEKYAKNKSIEHLRYEADALENIIQHKSIPIGTLDKGRIKYTLQVYKKHGLITNEIETGDYIFEPFNKKIVLSKEEKKWIKENPVVTLAAVKYQKPLLFLNDDGIASGILQDYFDIFSQTLGINIIATPKAKSDEGHTSAKKEGNYGLAAIFKHPENDKEYHTTNPYIFTNFVIFSTRENKNKYKSIDDLKGKKVAILSNHRMMKTHFSKIPDIELVYINDAVEQMNKLQYGEVDAIIGHVTYHAVINENLFTDIVAAFSDSKKFPISFGINKEHKILHGLLNKALKVLTQEKRDVIISKWIKSEDVQKNRILTIEEINYLKNKKVITMCIDPDWMPFEKNENGKHIGMSAEYIKILEKEIATPIKMISTKTWEESLKLGIERKCDIFSLVMPTKEREKYLDFTKSYLQIPLVIVTNIDEFFVNDISKIINKKIGIVKGYAYGEILKLKYPNMQLIEVKNLKDGLKQVNNGKLFGFIGTLVTTGFHIQKNYIGELKIAGKFDEKWELGIGTRNDEPILKNIFNKAIQQISINKQQEILNKWVSVSYDQDVNYKPLFQWIAIIVLVFSSILFIIIRVNRKLNKEIKTRIETEKKLQEITITDELTTLYNRRYFNKKFPQLINSAKRENQQICFALMDIDFFKLYNDTYGHINGDEALQKVSASLKSSLTRADDYCFRLGGEEFGILFKGLDKEEALELLENIKENIESLKIKHMKNTASSYITASFGLVVKEAKHVQNDDELYSEADALLYKAKDGGRNRVVIN